jgi:CRISPR-associated protein Cas1
MEKETLYVNSDCEIKKHSNNVVFYQNGEKQKSIPIILIRDIVIVGNIGLGSDVINLCKEHKILLHFISRGGKYYGSLNFDPALNIFPRLKQFEKRFNNKECNKIAVDMITKKLLNQKWFLNTYRIDFETPTIITEDEQELLGIEGSKSREYFSCWNKIIKNTDFIWTKRTKRPPEDEINALLSLSYTMLACEIHTICNMVALDPYIGFFHKDYYGRPSLVCDLMEQYRPFIDKFVINLINRNEIKKDDFEKQTNNIEFKIKNFGFFMSKWNDFFKENKWEGEMSLQEIIEKNIRIFCKELIGDL